jgi:ATP-dependent Lhr-like helicase
MAQQLLARHGVLTREAVSAEAIPGGFGTIYPVLKAMEEAGRIRRGYFVAGLGATQFAVPGALDLLRSFRGGASTIGEESPMSESLSLAATDPANPYGTTLRWPGTGDASSAGRTPMRTVGATVLLVEGALVGYLARSDRSLLTWLPDVEPMRSNSARSIARLLFERARSATAGGEAPRGMLIEEIDGGAPAEHPMAPFLVEAGFLAGALGFQPNFRVASTSG